MRHGGRGNPFALAAADISEGVSPTTHTFICSPPIFRPLRRERVGNKYAKTHGMAIAEPTKAEPWRNPAISIFNHPICSRLPVTPSSFPRLLEVRQHRQDAGRRGYGHSPPSQDGQFGTRISSRRSCRTSSAMAAWRKAWHGYRYTVLPCAGHCSNRQRMPHQQRRRRRRAAFRVQEGAINVEEVGISIRPAKNSRGPQLIATVCLFSKTERSAHH